MLLRRPAVRRARRARRAAPPSAGATAARAKVDRFDGRARVRRAAPPGRARPAPRGLAGARASSPAAPRARSRTGASRPSPATRACATSSAACPGSKPAVVVAAHYDTKDLPGFVGANDGAGGTAAVLELARALRQTKRPKGAPELRFVLFDGEEATDDDARLPRHRRARLEGLRAPPRRRAARAGAARLRRRQATCSIPREAGSDATLWARLRAAARRVGVGGGVPGRACSGEITDDHTPFTAPRRARDRPDRLRLPLLAQDLRRPERGLGELARPLAARRCSSCCGPGASARLHWPGWPPPPCRPRAAAARRPARLLRRRRPRRADRRARARALRRAGLRAQGDRPQQARGRAAARARRDLRRGARRHDPRGRRPPSSPPTASRRPSTPTPSSATCSRSTRPARW